MLHSHAATASRTPQLVGCKIEDEKQKGRLKKADRMGDYRRQTEREIKE